MNSTLARLADLHSIRHDTVAYALSFYDAHGQPAPLVWIEHAGLVRHFVGTIDGGRTQHAGLSLDLTQTVYLRLRDGRVLSAELADIERAKSGSLLLVDGMVTVDHELHTNICAAYALPRYDSGQVRRAERVTREPSTFREAAILPRSSKPVGKDTVDIALYVYQDDPGKDWNKRYAEAHALAAKTEAFGVDGLASLVNKLTALREQDKRVTTLVVAAHGGPAAFRIGPKDTPYDSPTRVGFMTHQTTPAQFGEAIAAALGAKPELWLLTCKTAKDDGTPESNGQVFIQKISTVAGAKVGASDENVSIAGAQAATEGNWYTATAGGDHPVVTHAKPAGNINP